MSEVGKTLREWNAQKGDVFYYHGFDIKGKPIAFDKFTSYGPVDDVGSRMIDDEYWHLINRATPDTDYNDGKWHAWDGVNKKPETIHDKSIIEYVWHDPRLNNAGKTTRIAGYDGKNSSPAWSHVLKLRVITPYVEPREGYICATIFKTAREAKIAYPGCNPIHVREVIENDA